MINSKFKSCIDACLACAVGCNSCVTDCLNEPDLKMMVSCIQLERQCSIICLATAQLMTIGGEHATHLCAECAEVCDLCAVECARHSHDHCKKCAEACLKYARECSYLAKEAA